MNIPVAVIALVLTFMAKPENEPVPARIDYRGAVLVAVGIGLSIFGLQQSVLWGWGNAGTWACIIGGLLVIAVFVVVEMRTPAPLINVEIFRIRAFSVENMVLFIAMMVFIPVFFFASEYAQISLRKTASEAGLFLLYFFIGFAVAAQIGGRILDREGAKRAVVMGCAIAAVGFGLWASKVTHLNFSSQVVWIIVAGAGMGMMLGPANTDAINRASSLSYGEATGITQTMRNYGASLGLAVLGTILLTVQRSKLTASLMARHVPHAAQVAATVLAVPGRAFGELHPPLLLIGLRLRHPDGPLRHVRDHGRSPAWWPSSALERGLQQTIPKRVRLPRRARPSDVDPVTSFFTGVRETLVPPPGRPPRSTPAACWWG